MDMIPADKNVGLGGVPPKGVQTPPQDETVKNPEKTEVGATTQQGDRVEIKSVLPKKDDATVKGFASKELDTSNQQLVDQMKSLITSTSSHALEAQAGGGQTFLKTLYQ